MGMTVTCRECGELFGVDDDYLRRHGLPETHAEIHEDCETARPVPDPEPESIEEVLRQTGDAVLLAAQQHADQIAGEIEFMNARAGLMDAINQWVATPTEDAGNRLTEAAHRFLVATLNHRDPRL